MEEKSTRNRFASREVWESLEEMARGRIQEFVQVLLEEEVTALVGRAKSERREAVDAPAVYRNGHGKPRKLAMMGGTVEVRRPRVRGLEERFESRILPLFRRRTQEVVNWTPNFPPSSTLKIPPSRSCQPLGRGGGCLWVGGRAAAGSDGWVRRRPASRKGWGDSTAPLQRPLQLGSSAVAADGSAVKGSLRVSRPALRFSFSR